jgi:hypothetical protein
MNICPAEFPLSWLNENVDNDELFARESLAVLLRTEALQPKHLQATYTLASSAKALVNSWLVDRRLYGYSRGRPIDDFAALTVITFDDDVGLGMQNLEATITIKREEVAALMAAEGITLPSCLCITSIPASTNTTPVADLSVASPPGAAKTQWTAAARELAISYVEAWREAGFEPTVSDAALFVEGELSSLSIFNTRGTYIDRETIKREALVGITNRSRGERRGTPKVPEGQRQKMPHAMRSPHSRDR